MHTYLSYKNKYINYSILITTNKINAYKNKFNTSRAKLPLTFSLVQNKPRKPTNTSIDIIDLDLHIYEQA
jgi:hypothetical protein